ncbi:MAG: TetR family transcriptional regulator C-terminal domain-containing protein [Planctomycetota bacterium]
MSTASLPQNTAARERMISAGTDLIAQKGYHGCGLNEILKVAEVPKGSFYHYFKSKEDFGVAIVEDFTARYGLKLSQKLTDRRHPPLERLRRHFQDAADWYEEYGYGQTCLVAKLGMDVASMSDDMREALNSGMAHWKAIFARCLREAQADGQIAASWDTDQLGSFLMDAWEGVAVQVQIAHDTGAIERFIDVTLNRMLAAG